MSRVTLERVAKRFDGVAAVDGIDLEVHEEECLSLLGPSGCGKTTTLRLIAGLAEPTSGRILIDGEDVTRVPPQKRDIGMVFQDYALFPHLTVEENIGFGLRERRIPGARIRARVSELLDLVRLPGIERRYPAELSGGQQQRVAVARAVAHPPRVLLMDEPLGALDLKLREAMQEELRRIQHELRITTVYVTHDQTEAMSLSDRIVVMSMGRVVQVGPPEDIYDRPRNRFVAQFVGKINFVPARVIGVDGRWGLVDAEGIPLRVAPEAVAGGAGRVTIAIRPERLRFVQPGTAVEDRNVLPGIVVGRSFAGNLTYSSVRVSAQLSLTVELRPGDPSVDAGKAAEIAWVPDHAWVLPEAGDVRDDYEAGVRMDRTVR
jgi:spermidine/putrescine ABC transporter ATP-binding subunit